MLLALLVFLPVFSLEPVLRQDPHQEALPPEPDGPSPLLFLFPPELVRHCGVGLAEEHLVVLVDHDPPYGRHPVAPAPVLKAQQARGIRQTEALGNLCHLVQLQVHQTGIQELQLDVPVLVDGDRVVGTHRIRTPRIRLPAAVEEALLRVEGFGGFLDLPRPKVLRPVVGFADAVRLEGLEAPGCPGLAGLGFERGGFQLRVPYPAALVQPPLCRERRLDVRSEVH
mmetsp:Transcript_6044/g.15010  ORF Transcript_6044/g.15010 Transcript_6044/m.15010 type:complete len:226 (-) Transcript_6044:776-1453(-)